MTDDSDPRPVSAHSAVVADGGADDPSLDRLFSALATPRQRAVLWLLADEGTVDRGEAATRLAADEHGVPRANVTANQREFVLTALHHVVLPKLRDGGLAEYDRESGAITAGPAFDRARPHLELARDQFTPADD